MSVLSLSSACSLPTGSDRDGRSYDIDGVTVLELRGSWHRMGRQYGILAKSRIEDVLDYLDRSIGPDPDRIAAAGEIADRLYAHYPDSLKSFFDGVSQTSGIPLGRLKLCNAAEYVEGVFLCSAMAVWDSYGSGKLVFGRNYDAVSYREIDRDVVVTVYHPADGVPAATIGYAGEIYCVNGLNTSGLFVELNNGMPSAGGQIHWDQCPLTTSLFDMLFSAESLDDVDSFIRGTRSSLSAIIGVADKSEARSYEWCFDGVRRGDEMTPDGLMIGTNHYVNDTWPFATPDDEGSWNSLTRRRNLTCAAERCKGSIGVEEMMGIMSASLEDGGPRHSLTRYQIVAVPEDLVLYVHIPSNGRWVRLEMKEFFD